MTQNPIKYKRDETLSPNSTSIKEVIIRKSEKQQKHKKKCLQTQVTLRQCGFLCCQRQLNQTQSVYCGTLLHSDQLHDNEEQMQNEKHCLTVCWPFRVSFVCLLGFLEFNCQGTDISAIRSENYKIPATTECGLLQQIASYRDPKRTVPAV